MTIKLWIWILSMCPLMSHRRSSQHISSPTRSLLPPELISIHVALTFRFCKDLQKNFKLKGVRNKRFKGSSRFQETLKCIFQCMQVQNNQNNNLYDVFSIVCRTMLCYVHGRTMLEEPFLQVKDGVQEDDFRELQLFLWSLPLNLKSFFCLWDCQNLLDWWKKKEPAKANLTNLALSWKVERSAVCSEENLLLEAQKVWDSVQV